MALVLGTNHGFVTTRPTTNPSATAGTMDNAGRGQYDTSPSTAVKVTEIGWWCDNATQEANYEVGIYSDAGNGEPETRLHVSTTNAKGTTAGWKYVTVDFSIDSSTNYWLCVQLDNTSTLTKIDFTNSGGTGMVFTNGLTTLPSDWGTSGFKSTTYKTAIYAVWEEDSVPAVKVNIGDSWKTASAVKINIGDVWKDVVAIKQNISDTWKDV